MLAEIRPNNREKIVFAIILILFIGLGFLVKNTSFTGFVVGNLTNITEINDTIEENITEIIKNITIKLNKTIDILNETTFENVTENTTLESISVNKTVIKNITIETNETIVQEVNIIPKSYVEDQEEAVLKTTIANVEINKPVKWVKKINASKVKDFKLPKNAFNIKGINFKPNKKEFDLQNVDEVIDIEYYLDGPKIKEELVNTHKKKITVSSDIHYENVLTHTEIKESPENAIKVYWIKETGKELFTDIEYIDTNNNGLIDKLQWIIPHLSNQTFEISIAILNSVEYLRDGDTWTIVFNTTGEADLIINSTNAFWTEIITDNQETVDEMEFLDIKCGDISIKDSLVINSVYEYNSLRAEDSIKPKQFIIYNYSCDELGYFSNYMHKAGYATLMFTYANEDFNVRDYAYDPISGFLPNNISNNAYKVTTTTTIDNPWDATTELTTYDYSTVNASDNTRFKKNIKRVSSGTSYWFARLTFNLSSIDINDVTSLKYCVEGNATRDWIIGENIFANILYYNTSSSSWIHFDNLTAVENTYCQEFTDNNAITDIYNSTSELFEVALRGLSTYTIGVANTYIDIDYVNLSIDLMSPYVDTPTISPTTPTVDDSLTCSFTAFNSTNNITVWYLNNESIMSAYLPFEADPYSRDEGNNMTDYSGHANHGTFAGSGTDPTWEPSGGKIGGAYNFWDARVISLTSPPPSENGTISVWVKPKAYPDGYCCSDILADPGTGSGDFRWYINTGSSSLYGFFISGEYRVSTSQYPGVGIWTHVALMWNNSGTYLYFNGSEIASNTGSGGPPTFSGSGLQIGGNTGSGDREFNGTIDEVRVYNRSLTPEEIMQHFLLEYNKLNANETKSNDELFCSVTPHDTFTLGYNKNSSSVIIQAASTSPPSISSVAIKPDSASTSDNLDCNATISDPDNSTVIVEYWWYNQTSGSDLIFNGNTTSVTTGNNYKITTLGSGNTTSNEVWNCTIKAYDGNDYSIKNSDTITISTPNNQPTFSLNPYITPTSPTTTNTLFCNFTATDTDSDPVSNITNWYLNNKSITILYLPFDGGTTSSYAKDYSGRGNDLDTAQASPIYNATGGRGSGALIVDGDDFLRTSDTAPEFNLRENFSVSVWFKLSAAGEWGNIMRKDDTISVGVAQTTPKLGFQLWNGSGNICGGWTVGGTTLGYNTWYHAVYVYNSTHYIVYLNGTEDGSGDCGGFLQSTGNDLAIGGRTTFTEYFNGTIDELIIFNRTLGANQIKTMFETGSLYRLNHTETNEDEEWHCEVTLNDGEEDGESKNSTSVVLTIENPASYSSFSGDTTIFNSEPDIESVSDATLENVGIGKIIWYNNVNASSQDFDTYVTISENYISVDSANLHSSFNSIANLTLAGLNYYDPVILKDGILCSDCVETRYSNGNLTFNVSGFSAYTTTDNATLTIWDGSDTEGGSNTYYINQQIPFRANYTLTNDSIVSNETCTVEFSDLIANMTFNITSNLYDYNRTFTSKGIKYYNISCNSTIALNITTQDNITIANNLPTVNSIQITPVITSNSSVINITTNITDEDSVSSAMANLYYPNSSFWMNTTLEQNGDIWYNDTITLLNSPLGNYTVYIWAQDDSNDVNDTEKSSFNLYQKIRRNASEIVIDGDLNDWNNIPVIYDEIENNVDYFDLFNFSITNNNTELFIRLGIKENINYVNETEYYRIYLSKNSSGGNAFSTNGSNRLSFKYDSRIEIFNENSCGIYDSSSTYLGSCLIKNTSKEMEISASLQSLSININDTINVSVETGVALTNTSAGNEITSWNKKLGTSNADNAYDMVIDNEGYIYVAGDRNSKWHIKKFNSNGNEFTNVEGWNKTLNFAGAANSIAVDDNNNIYVVGDDGDNWIIKKFNSTGYEFTEVEGWNKSLGKADSDSAKGVAVDNNNNIYVVGVIENLITGSSQGDWWIKKFNSSGYEFNNTEGWNKSYDSYLQWDEARAVIVDSNNDVYVTGYGNNLTGQDSQADWWIKKFNSSGYEFNNNEGWNKSYDSNLQDNIAYTLTLDEQDNLYVAGYGYDLITATSREDFWIKKLNSTGSEDSNWNISIGIDNQDEGIWSLAIENNTYLYAAGYYDGDWWIKKFDMSGNEQDVWDKMYDGNSGSDVARGVIVKNRQVYVAGHGSDIISGSSNTDWWIKKFDLGSTVYDSMPDYPSFINYKIAEEDNTPPIITWINTSVSAIPLANSVRTIYLQFNATDVNGAGDINNKTAKIYLNLTGEQTRYNDSCKLTNTEGNTQTFECAIDMQYYDLNGDWTINTSIRDNSGIAAQNITTTVSYGSLKHIALGTNLLNFTNIYTGDQNIAPVQNPLHIDNQGNQEITEINITAYDLIKSAEIIGATNFTINASNGSGIGTFLINNTMITLPNGNLSRDTNGNDNNASLYIYLDIPTGLTSGIFNASNQWSIKVN